MECPGGHGPMAHVGRFLVCGQCGYQAECSARPSPGVSDSYQRLPSILAIPLAEFAGETHPVMRLHRLCDAVEIVTRFCTIVALGELRQRLADQPLPNTLLEALQPQIERPTFGQWRNMLATIVEHLARASPLVARTARLRRAPIAAGAFGGQESPGEAPDRVA